MDNKKKDSKPKSRPNTQKQKKNGKPKTGQILMIVFLGLLVILLTALIFIIFQPQRIDIWEQNPGTAASSDKPEIQRLQNDPIAPPPEMTPPKEEIEEALEKTSVELKIREARLYFVKINAEGLISLKSTTRNIQYENSPLTNTINTLLAGPNSSEINKGALTLIPDESRLLSARVESGTVYLNFDENFRFNSLGREGYQAQLKQIIYTATEFANVMNVQFLIEGSVKDYLGGEGIYIGQPLGREDLQDF